MQQLKLLDKFPVFSTDIPKSATPHENVDAIIEALKEKVLAHPTGTVIGVFDHYAHVNNNGGEIDASILDSKHLLFCLSNALPNPMISAARPRAIAVNELADRFVINFMEAPMEAATQKMREWVESLATA